MPAPLSIRKGTSKSRDCATAAEELYSAISQPDIKLAIFYCASDYDLPALARELCSRFEDINLIGCTTAGEITPQGYLHGALTGVSIASPDMDARTQIFRVDPFDSANTSRAVSDLLASLGSSGGLPPSSTDTFAFMLIDGLSMQEEMAVSCIHQPLQGIELIGGSAADDVRFGATHIYYRGEFRSGVAVLSLVRT
jgi:hypothetical protein